MLEYFETRSEALNELLGGGILRGEGLLIKQDLPCAADRIFLSAVPDVLDNMFTAVLVLRPSVSRELAEEYLGRLNVSLSPLLDNDQLFVIDLADKWPAHENVFHVTEPATIREATKTALRRSRARGTIHMLDINTVVDVLGAEEARSLRQWYQTDAFRGRRDYLIEAMDVSKFPADLISFYETMDKQVLSIERSDGELRLVVEAAPEGKVGEARTVEFHDEPPFIQFR